MESVMGKFGLILVAGLFFGLGFMFMMVGRPRPLIALIPFFCHGFVNTYIYTNSPLYGRPLLERLLAAALLAIAMIPLMYGLRWLSGKFDKWRSRQTTPTNTAR